MHRSAREWIIAQSAKRVKCMQHRDMTNLSKCCKSSHHFEYGQHYTTKFWQYNYFMKLEWHVNDKTGTREFVPGRNIISVETTPDEVITRAEAFLSVPPSPKLFFNGFQTWTHCPEFSPESRIRGVKGIPKLVVKALALDHFADYHFVHYPNQKGSLHGFSYCYFRDGSHYRLFASLNEKPGYTIFSYNSLKELLTIERDCIGVAADGPSFNAFELFYAEGSEQEVFDSWFEAMGISSAAAPIKGYSSWYNHYQKINERTIRDDLAGAEKIFDPGDLFQIDDGWEPYVGDWENVNRRKFPNGMEGLVRDIHAAGFQAGLWLAPFVCEKKSRIYREHPDWLLLYKGKPWKNGPNWGGFYSLDIDHPEFRDYLTRVFAQIFDEWIFDLVKLDFLYAAAPFATGDHGLPEDVPYSESRAGRMIRALTFLRELCRDKLILGCGVPVMPAFGLVDYCRVGSDVGLDWDDMALMRGIHRERVSTRQSIDNTIFRRQLNGRAYGSDPDVFFLRDRNIFLSGREKAYHAAVNALFGSVLLTSDDLNAFDQTKTEQFRRIAQLKNAENVSIDPDTFTIKYTLDGKEHTLLYPH